jgi:hypothetical protein
MADTKSGFTDQEQGVKVETISPFAGTPMGLLLNMKAAAKAGEKESPEGPCNRSR